jgi:hypothetical protein
MANEYVDFAALKRATSIERVADWLGLKTKKHGNQLRCACPVTGGGDRALVITPAEDVFYCFAPRCQKGGDLLELIAHVHQVATRDAALSLQQHLWPQGELKALHYLMHDVEQVQCLGVPPHVAKALGIGYAPRGTMAGRVCFPLRDDKGKLVGYLGVGEDGIRLPKRFFL